MPETFLVSYIHKGPVYSNCIFGFCRNTSENTQRWNASLVTDARNAEVTTGGSTEFHFARNLIHRYIAACEL